MGTIEIIKTLHNGQAVIVHSETDDGQTVEQIILSTRGPELELTADPE